MSYYLCEYPDIEGCSYIFVEQDQIVQRFGLASWNELLKGDFEMERGGEKVFFEPSYGEGLRITKFADGYHKIIFDAGERTRNLNELRKVPK